LPGKNVNSAESDFIFLDHFRLCKCELYATVGEQLREIREKTAYNPILFLTNRCIRRYNLPSAVNLARFARLEDCGYRSDNEVNPSILAKRSFYDEK